MLRTRRTRAMRLAVLPLAIGAALALGACGGDDDSDETIALSEWITQADEICTEAGATIDSEAEATFSGSEQPSPEELESFVTETVVPNLRTQISNLRDLPEPDEQADTVDEMLNSVEEGTDEIEEDPEAFVAQQESSAFDRANELATEVGLEECGDA